MRLATLFGLMLCSAVCAQGDDWPQFRHDANRSAASADELRFPLKERWSWKTRSRNGHTPLYHAAIWHGKAFFTMTDKGQRFLVCTEAETGKVLWYQALEAEQLNFKLSDITGPAVSDGGLVYVYDWVMESGVKSRSGLIHMGQETSSSGIVEPVSSFCVRVFEAKTGKEKHMLPLAMMGANGVLPRLSLTEDDDGQEVNPVPPTFVGCPP